MLKAAVRVMQEPLDVPDSKSTPCNWVAIYSLPMPHLELLRWKSMEIQEIHFSLYRRNCILQQHSLCYLCISFFWDPCILQHFAKWKKRTARMTTLREFPFPPGCHILVAMAVHRLRRALLSWILCNSSSCSSGESLSPVKFVSEISVVIISCGLQTLLLPCDLNSLLPGQN